MYELTYWNFVPMLATSRFGHVLFNLRSEYVYIRKHCVD